MSRDLTEHKVGSLNEALQVIAIGQPQPPGMACCDYSIRVPTGKGVYRTDPLIFQKGDPKDGINGISNEVLLAVVLDRLRGFQTGLGNCRENAIAITNIETALLYLQKRTRERMERGVEGSTTP